MATVPNFLFDLQSAFARALHAGEAAPLLERVLEDRTRSAASRVRVYQRSYEIRLLGALEEDFPETRDALGAQAWTAVAVSYLRRYPSHSYTLDLFGQHFANHLLEEGQTPRIVAHAQFEWAVAHARLYASDARRLPPAPTPTGPVAFTAHTSVTLLPQGRLVHAALGEVADLSLDPAAQVLFSRLTTGEPAESVLAAYLDSDAPWLTAQISEWVGAGILRVRSID